MLLLKLVLNVNLNGQVILTKGKDAYGNMDKNKRFEGEMSQCVINIDSVVDEMAAAASKAAAESARGIMEIDKASRFIQECITTYNKPGYQGNKDADATSLV